MAPRGRNARRSFEPVGHAALALLRSNSKLVNGQADPPGLSIDVIVTKTFEYIEASATPLNLTPAFIAAAFPGGALVFTRMRLVKLSVWKNGTTAVPTVTVRILDDQAEFRDRGTTNARAAQLHVSPTFDVRNRWVDSSNENALAVISGDADGSTTIHVTVEMRSVPDAI